MKTQLQTETSGAGRSAVQLTIDSRTAGQPVFFFDGAFRTWLEVEQRARFEQRHRCDGRS